MGEGFKSSSDRFAIFLVGPSASGKSELAHFLARKWDLEIVNCDSVQVYKLLDIGSAKPSKREMSEIRHHLYDIVSPPAKMTAGEYRRLVLELVETTRKNLIFVGGSGFYFQAIEYGMYNATKSDPDLRIRLESDLQQKGLSSLYDELSRLDSEYAAKISGNDRYRILRGLETIELEGKTVTAIRNEFKQSTFPLPILKMAIDVNRSDLRARVSLRTNKMIEQGIIEEMSEIRKLGLSEWAPLSSVGYKQVGLYLDGQLERELLAEQITTSTMQLAKRQRTWFNRDDQINWLKFDQSETLFEDAQTLTQQFVDRILRI